MMYTIMCPVAGYKGKGYGLDFSAGKAVTEDAQLAKKLAAKGWKVTEQKTKTAGTEQ